MNIHKLKDPLQKKMETCGKKAISKSNATLFIHFFNLLSAVNQGEGTLQGVNRDSKTEG